MTSAALQEAQAGLEAKRIGPGKMLSRFVIFEFLQRDKYEMISGILVLIVY